MEPTPVLPITRKYWQVMQTIATVAFIGSNLLLGRTSVGDGIVTGLVVYAIWFTRERK
jgi:hypothetical protein